MARKCDGYKMGMILVQEQCLGVGIYFNHCILYTEGIRAIAAMGGLR